MTIPYKQLVIPYCDEVDEGARSIGAVNTLVNRGGRLYGYNTDFGGVLYMLRAHDITLEGKNVLILGTGGTHNTVAAVAGIWAPPGGNGKPERRPGPAQL